MYRAAAATAPVLFLHGDPASSHQWRTVLTGLGDQFRHCVAVDLIGMGRSQHLAGDGGGCYRLAAHIHYLSELIDRLDLGQPITFVGYD